ncbi:hypothetical protein AB0F91_45595 [Amycolatopsis sp. NPDC023774]|uniref:hypothetical protein n=1 Tax=Amycolatopsis sp. NPDC023774 TaxID=3155015 RepID=UPI00340EE386
MREWLIAMAAGYALVLVSFVVVVAVLDRNLRRANPAARVLRMLLLGAAPGATGVLLKMHQAVLL